MGNSCGAAAQNKLPKNHYLLLNFLPWLFPHYIRLIKRNIISTSKGKIRTLNFKRKKTEMSTITLGH